MTLEEMERLLAETTPGPWHACEDGVLFGTSADDSGVWQREDATLVAAAREWVPWSVEAIRGRDRALRAAMDALNEKTQMLNDALVAVDLLERKLAASEGGSD